MSRSASCVRIQLCAGCTACCTPAVVSIMAKLQTGRPLPAHQLTIVRCFPLKCGCSCRQMGDRPGRRQACRGARLPCRPRCGTASQGALQDRYPLALLPVSMSACMSLSAGRNAWRSSDLVEMEASHGGSMFVGFPKASRRAAAARSLLGASSSCIIGLGQCLWAAFQHSLMVLCSPNVWVCP